MKRMVDDKEIREFDDRITALEQGGGGGSSDTAKKLQDTAAGQIGVVEVVDEEEYANLFLGIKGQNDAVYKNYVVVGSDGYVGVKANDSFEFGVQGNKGSFFAAKENDIEITPDTGYDVNFKVGGLGNVYITKTGQGTLVKKRVAIVDDIPTYSAGTGIDITNGQISVDNTVVTKDTDGNVEALYLPSINSPDGEDTDCKGRVNLTSGARRGIVTIEAEGEDSQASIEVRGSTSGEGMITITGDLIIDTAIRPKVGSGLNQEQIAYLSDITSASVYEYELRFQDEESTPTVYVVKFMSSNGSLINTSVPEDFNELVTFIQIYGIERQINATRSVFTMEGYTVNSSTQVPTWSRLTAIKDTNGNVNQLWYNINGQSSHQLTDLDVDYTSIELWKRTI